MQQLVRMFPDVVVHTPYPIQFGGDDWITVVTNVARTFAGEMAPSPTARRCPPDGKAIRPRNSPRPSKWEGRRLIVISTLWDSAVMNKQIGLAQ